MAADATTADTGSEPDAATSGSPTPGELGKIADGLRSRVDLFGKTLAAIATLGTTWAGVSKVSDLFPAKGDGWLVALACAGLAAAALAAIGIAVRLMRVAGPVFVTPDYTHDEDVDPQDEKRVKRIFDTAANRFGHGSLVGLQERERSLRKAAARTSDETERARRTALADEVRAEIDRALALGRVAVVRRRATQAVGDPPAFALYFAVIVGLIAFALGTDAVSSDREDPIAKAKACGEARKAGATEDELAKAKDYCVKKPEEPKQAPKPPSAAEARTQVSQKLTDALDACTKLVKKEGETGRPLEDSDCNPVRRALSSVNATP